MPKVSRVLMAALLAAGVLAGPFGGPAHAEEVTVVFNATGTNGEAHTAATCALSVQSGASGLDVLDEAEATNCISGYQITYFPSHDSYFVNAIDGVRDGAGALDVCYFWMFFENGVLATGGIDDYRARDGTLTFALAPFGARALGFC